MNDTAPDIGMAEAFTRDPILEASVRALVRKHGIKTVIETGTWRGYTTRRFAEFVPNVATIEIDKATHEIAKKNFEGVPNITAYHGSSDGMLMSFVQASATQHDGCPILYYLDAHWGEQWPILAELGLIACWPQPCVIVVHDCQVPDRDFKFDTYNGQPLNFEYLKPKLDLLRFPWKHSFNREAAGYRIGALFIEPA